MHPRVIDRKKECARERERDRKKEIYLQTGEEVGQFGVEGEEDEADEAGLGGGFGDFVSIHERGDRESPQFLHVTLANRSKGDNTFKSHALPYYP